MVHQLRTRPFCTYTIGTGAGQLAELHNEVIVICHVADFCGWLGVMPAPVLAKGCWVGAKCVDDAAFATLCWPQQRLGRGHSAVGDLVRSVEACEG